MNFGLFQRITREMRQAGVEEVGLFFLGESFSNTKLLHNAVLWVKGVLEFPYAFLTTNGALCDGESLDNVMRAGLDSLKFSVNAANEEQFREIMGVSSKYFHRSLENLRNARRIRDENGYKTKIYASSIRYDGEQQARMQAFLDEFVIHYVDEHYWLPLYSMGSFATQREQELGYKPIAGNQGRYDNPVDPLPCWSAFTEGHVRADGGLSACCFDAGGQWVMGDLTRQSFMDAWHSEPFVSLRAAHLKGDVSGTICEQCVAYS